jgi:hypothetical protein
MANKARSIIAAVDVAATQEQVWEMARDTSRYADWVESTVKVIRADGPTAPGTTYDELTRVGGPWKTTTHWRVAEFNAPTRQIHEGTGLVTARGLKLVMETEPSGTGTRFTMTLSYTPRFGVAGAALDRVVGGSVTRAQQRSAQAFAGIVERERTLASARR